MTKAFIIGATGEVGKCVLEELLANDHFTEIIAISRKEITCSNPNAHKLKVKVIPNFDDLEQHKSYIKDCQAGFCTLGSTRAKAGSAEAFEHIDYDYTMVIGKMAKETGCNWFGVVTSVGADPNSSFLYPRVKGRIERDLEKLEFPCLAIFRPGFLLCERKESRALEKLGMFFAKGINWCIPNRIAIPTETVAKAMVKDSINGLSKSSNPQNSVSIYDNKQIAAIAE